MGLKYKRIHACHSDCVLYKDGLVALKVYSTRELSQFKKKLDGSSGEEEKEGSLVKVLWYLPIIPRFK